MIHTEVMYGFCAVEDPRKFTLDPECCTEDEVARHKADCEAWDRGERPNRGGCHHFSKQGYGLGTYEYTWECGGDPLCHMCGDGPDVGALP